MKFVTKLVTPLIGLAGGPWLVLGPAALEGQFAADPLWMSLGAFTFVASLAAICLLFVTDVVRPAATLAAVADRLATGDLETPTPDLSKARELRAVAAALERLRAALKESARHLSSERAAQQKTALERKAASDAEAQGYIEAHSFFMKSFTAALEELSSGNLSHHLSAPFSSDYEKLRHCYNAAIGKLRGVFSEMFGHVDGLSSRTHEIAGAADALSQRTEQQAASLEETSAALEQITTTVHQTSEGARHAAQVVSGVRTDAEKSSEVVNRAIAAMGRIENSSREIGQIIGVIDEIAFQTNLLALNAGVEAARAGEAGRGFAVVASEVRALAQRSAEAAREIKDLISTSTSQVEEGVTLVEQTGTSLNRIVEQVVQANKVVADIANGAQEQSTGLREVNTAVAQMDQFTQQNAAMVEETTAISHGLRSDIEQLTKSLSVFGLGRESGSEQPATAAFEPRAAAKPLRASPHRKTIPALRGSSAVPKEQVAPSEQNWEEF